MAEDFYKVLGIPKTASAEEIQKAYRTLARKYHPDMNPDDPDGAKKKFQKLQEAFDVLKDPEKRAQYDRFGADFARYQGAGGPGGPGAGAGPFGGFHPGGGASRSGFNPRGKIGRGASRRTGRLTIRRPASGRSRPSSSTRSELSGRRRGFGRGWNY